MVTVMRARHARGGSKTRVTRGGQGGRARRGIVRRHVAGEEEVVKDTRCVRVTKHTTRVTRLTEMVSKQVNEFRY